MLHSNLTDAERREYWRLRSDNEWLGILIEPPFWYRATPRSLSGRFLQWLLQGEASRRAAWDNGEAGFLLTPRLPFINALRERRGWR